MIPVLMLGTAPPRRVSAIDVGAVEAFTALLHSMCPLVSGVTQNTGRFDERAQLARLAVALRSSRTWSAAAAPARIAPVKPPLPAYDEAK